MARLGRGFPATNRLSWAIVSILGISVTTDVGALTLTGFAPTVAVSNNQSVTAGVGALTLTGFAPTATATGGTPHGNSVVVSDLSNLFLKQTVGAPTFASGPTLADLKSRQKSERRERQQRATAARATADAASAQFMADQAAQHAAKRKRDMTALLAAWMEDDDE